MEDHERDDFLRQQERAEQDLKNLLAKGKGPEQDPGPSRPVRVIGDFRIIREIGKGGMGTVFEAEQISLKRKVALKILPSHLSLSEDAVLKFQREAEAGARQSHPGIVAVYAVGEADGHHFIAQELIEGGRTLADTFVEMRRLPEVPAHYYKEVADLFAKIADALQHAHDAGVIHRDIKPSNILLTEEGHHKVADFGLAKIEDALALSRSGDFSGTPYYMSPEQAMSRVMGIDHRTDIFSLGATLYEALTFTRAFEGDTNQQVLEKITFEDPPDPRRVRSRVPRDLAVICLRALEKKRERRYVTMSELAADLRRYLANEPILARPPDPWHRTMKWVRRHPVISASGSVALAAFLVVLVLLIRLHRKSDALEQALIVTRAEKTRADEEAGLSEATLEFMKGLFESSDPENARGDTVTAKEILDRGAEKIAKGFDDRPRIRARLMATMGTVYRSLGQYKEAETLLRDALKIYRSLLGRDHPDTLRVLNDLAGLHGDQGRIEEAEEGIREAYEQRRLMLGEDHPDTLRSMANLANILKDRGRIDEAEALYLQSLEKRRRVLGEDHSDTLSSLNNLAVFYAGQDRLEKAEPIYLEALEKRRRVLGEAHPDTLETLGNLATLYARQGRFDEAEPLYAEAIPKQRRVLGENHPDTLRSLNNLAGLYWSQGRHSEAEKLYEETLEKRRGLGEEDRETLGIMVNLASLYAAKGADDKAEPLFLEVLERQRRVLGESHPETLRSLNGLAFLYHSQGRDKEALALAEELVRRTPKEDRTYGERKELLDEIRKKAR